MALTNIKKVKNLQEDNNITIALLSAGIGSKIKSYEPRSLIKIDNKPLIENQIKTIREVFRNPDIISVVGCFANRVIKRIKKSVRVVENQLFKTTNSSESLRLAFNNSMHDKFMFIHGDIFFNQKCLNVDYHESFIIIDSNQMIKDNEIGVTIVDKKASVLSYGLKTKWAQIAYFTGKEHKLLSSILHKFEDKDKKKLSFEIINEVIDAGGKFHCYEPSKMKLLEIDRIRDIK
jgi:choline kinase